MQYTAGTSLPCICLSCGHFKLLLGVQNACTNQQELAPHSSCAATAWQAAHAVAHASTYHPDRARTTTFQLCLHNCQSVTVAGLTSRPVRHSSSAKAAAQLDTAAEATCLYEKCWHAAAQVKGHGKSGSSSLLLAWTLLLSLDQVYIPDIYVPLTHVFCHVFCNTAHSCMQACLLRARSNFSFCPRVHTWPRYAVG